jgi:hypothetical protein
MAKLKGAPTKLAKHVKDASTQKSASKLSNKPADQTKPTLKKKSERKYNEKGFAPLTFHFHKEDIEWLEKRVQEWSTRSTASPVTITRLLRLAIRQLREKDLEKLID